MSTRSSTLIGAAVALALFKQAAPAYSQADTPRTGEPIEEVVVTGIRAQLARVDRHEARGDGRRRCVISAEDVGKFPDKNLAEALQRVPGVVINREFGEGERVSVRGTSPNLTKTLLNGHSVATADWFVLEQLATTRSFNYLMMPSEVIGQVIVNKSIAGGSRRGRHRRHDRRAHAQSARSRSARP